MNRRDLPRPNMQDEVIVDVINYYMNYMNPFKQLAIQNLDKKEFRPDFLRSGGAGRVRGLSRNGVWRDLF